MPEQQWQTFSLDAKLSENTVHVWRAALHTPASVVRYYQRYLIEEEITRAGRFHFEKDRNHFIVAHSILRILIGRYLNIEPRQLRFCLNAYGKPSLESSLHVPPLSFNISHAHDLALYAFTYVRQVGVDVEYMRLGGEDSRDDDYEQLAQRYFSPYERTVLQTLPVEEKQRAFFQCWTRKEAYIKAKGTGLSLPLDLFDVSLRPNEPAALLQSRESPQEAARWSLRELAPGTGYVGALAVEGKKDWQLHCWQWEA
ncbi:MAG: 4'-phosphopantetheinyl transferase family protein [Ktedonobacteraceae bacterium]